MSRFADTQTIEGRYRLFLLMVAAALMIGTPVELWLTGHTENPIQWIPFVLCGAGLLAVPLALFRPSRETLHFLQVVMVVMMLGACLGIFQHYTHNIEFALEIRPNAVLGDVILEALQGANPLLAPGILALAGLLALAATYRHPLLVDAETHR